MSSSIPPSLYEYCQPTLLTEWSDDLLAHSFDTRFIYLDAAQSELLSRGPLWRGPVWGYADPVASALIEKLEPAVRARAGVLHRLIAQYCQTWSNLLPRDSVVADVVAPEWDGRALDDAAPPRLVLSELNPWHGMTYAGWFDWRRPQDFDGSLRCN